MQTTGDDEFQSSRIVSSVSTDPRAEHTRQLVFAAVRQVLSDRPTRVTVADIVRAAGISRSTFYAHFGSLDELAVEVLRRQFDEIGDLGVDWRRDDMIPGRAAARLGFGRLIDHIVDNFPLYSSALQTPHTRSAYDALVESYVTRLMHAVITLDTVPDDVDAKLVSTFIAGGAMTLISAWMRGQIELSDDDLVRQLVDLLPHWILESPTKETTQQ
ncbi:MAG: TetR/AcrR family transcriptional regulator [Rhodoglobus sp.]|uniref:TetR/AcrR family transcriptional regulator n=1 Tax=Salinibacterium sp. G-O1 TaxID=3046208 RepID=UPI0024BA66B5|nr:TetR/AcrR family transcriptional regulator [Salinibacterium sp. G-O1]MDJ0334078.1 TetR/AcrR family transcriptional regulator [Salinibacterium sp. G-O1]